MATYFFHLHQCDQVYLDSEGLDLPDLAVARSRAVDVARELMAAEIVEGKLCLGCRIDIADIFGDTLAAVHFKDAVDIVTI